MKRIVAENESGEVIAVGEFNHLFFEYHPRKFSLNIEVDQEWQRKGIGGMVYEHLLSDLQTMGAEVVWSEVLSGSASGENFVKKRGFVKRRTVLESTLDLASADLGGLTPLETRLREEGIVVTNLAAEIHEDKDAGRKLFDLENSADKDVPKIVEDLPMSYHDYAILILNSPLYVWEGSFVAKHGDQYVGSSSVLRTARNDVLDQGFTAVRPDFRGRGIAQAVKLRVAEHAKKIGVRLLITNNDSRNGPMLAVNRKLGFVEQSERVTFQKEIA
jgi:GNAT superfamily N-acetyltransferase